MKQSRLPNILSYFLCLIVFFTHLNAEIAEKEPLAKPSEKEFLVLRSREAGMFSMFCDVLRLLDCYEKGYFSGIQVDFAEAGRYYDPNYGPNWWEYYCEPIFMGDKNQAKVRDVLGNKIPNAMPYIKMRTYDRKKIYDIIQKYIHPKPHLIEKIDQFVSENFKDAFIIGIHYRGTDKEKEAPRVAYSKVVEKLKEEIEHLNLVCYKIFIATDEQAFIDYMSQLFPDKICYYGAIRSEDQSPVHHRTTDQYRIGEDALIDCLLLSKTNLLIRMASSLSLWSTFFNPYLPVIALNQYRK